jgi:tetratricopeptide (TPR) repeat protein
MGIALASFVSTARAEWLEVSSDHFVIYGDQNAEKVQQFAERLERYHAAMSYVNGVKQTKPSPSNRVRIFAVANAKTVRKVLGTKERYLAGVYIPRAGGSVALIPKLEKASMYDMSGESILYHEYAHHFMRAVLTPRAFPRWFTEGFAEFYANPKFNKDGTISVGAPPYYRAAELRYARVVPIRTMLSFDGGAGGSGFDAFYGQSWVLFHYLQMEPERSGQLAKYQQLLASGKPALAAAEAAFGDLDKLDSDMESYMRRRNVAVRVIDGKALETGPIAIRKLRVGEAAMMSTIIESKVGVNAEEAKALVPVARKIATTHSDDAVVLAALAEAEFDAGNDDAAITAADQALAIDPTQIDAQLQKGYALARKALSGNPASPTWKDVRAQFVKANAVENDHPVPLLYFYLSYKQAGLTPTQNAVDGLEWALKLAPYDPSLRWLVVQQMVADERLSDAIVTLGPLAYSPHASSETEKAVTLLKELEARVQSTSSSEEKTSGVAHEPQSAAGQSQGPDSE